MCVNKISVLLVRDDRYFLIFDLFFKIKKSETLDYKKYTVRKHQSDLFILILKHIIIPLQHRSYLLKCFSI